MTRLLMTATCLAALCLAASAADGRYLLTLEKAQPDGAARTLALDCAQGAFTLVGGDASAVKLDNDKLRGKVTLGDAWYGLDCIVAKGAVTGKYTGTVDGKAVTGAVMGAFDPAWVGYRGPEATGVFADSAPPIDCDMRTGRNILWRTPLPNWAHASPVVAKGRAFVMSEPGWKHDWPVLSCIDIATGTVLWEREINHLPATGLPQAKQEEIARNWHDFQAEWRKLYTAFAETVGQKRPEEETKARFKEMGYAYGGFRGGGYGQLRSLGPKPKFFSREAGLRDDVWRHACGLGYDEIGAAFATPVTDGESVFVVASRSAAACYDFDGNLRWMRFMPFPPELRGYNESNGRSPILYKDLMISDYFGYTAAFDKQTGEVRWTAKTYGAGIATPGIITVDGTDILLTEGQPDGMYALRLPDGMMLKLDGRGMSSNVIVVNTDQRDVAFFGSGCHGSFSGAPKTEGKPLWTSRPAAVRFSLDGDTLKAAVLWEGKDLNNTVPADIPMVYYAGRLYVGDTVVDALTGVAIDGKAMGRSAVPPTHHLLYVASDRLYGLEGNVRLCDGAPPPDKATVTLTCSSLDGRLLGAGTCTMAPIDDEKRTQIRSQVGWDSWAFGYGLPFTIAGDRLYLRSSDELICVGHAAKGAPGDDPKVVDAIRAETDAAKLAARLDDASAQYRCEAMARLAALKPALSDEARDALRKAVVEDLYEEVRAAAVLALDACDPEGNAGWTALAAEMTEAQAKAVPWGKPGFAESQERLRRARVTLRPLGDGGKAYLEKRWPDARTPALRYALLDTATACGWKVDAIVTDVLAALKDGNRWRNEPARRLLLPYLAAIDAAADPKLAEAIVGIHDWGLYATCRYHLSNAQFLSWLEPIAMTTMRPDDRNRALLNWRRIGAEAIPSMERVAARMGADEKNAQAKSYVDAINALIAELKAA